MSVNDIVNTITVETFTPDINMQAVDKALNQGLLFVWFVCDVWI